MIRLYRASGHPVSSEGQKEYLEKLNKRMDELESEGIKDMAEISKELEAIHKEIIEKYPISLDLDFPKSREELEILLNKFGVLAFCLEDDKITAYIMDR